MRLKTVRLVLLSAAISGLLPQLASASPIVVEAFAARTYVSAGTFATDGGLVAFDGTLTTINAGADPFVFDATDDRTSRSRLDALDLTAIPEPASLLLLGSGLIGTSMLLFRRKA